jgi:FSR family fosmidomycin resistance protein-like MFS transporter
MTTPTVTAVDPPKTDEAKFQTGEVLTIVGGHFVHDTYSAFLAPILPLIISRLSLSLTLAGSLQAVLQMPALLNPFIGYLADKVSLRYFVILAPGITATLMSLIGAAPSYVALVIIMFTAGISVACFHAPAPAMIARISGQQVGKGMSLFMAGGELGRTVGPLLATWAVTYLTLDGFYQIMILGWVASGLLFWRLHRISARPEPPRDIRQVLPTLGRLFLPMLFVVLFRAFLLTPISVFLPTLMNLKGSTLWGGAGSLAVWELAGVAGALFGGTLSDRVGRKTILYIGFISSIILTLIFLQTEGWLFVPVLIMMGLTSLSTQPVLLAIVQDHLPENRAVGNGIFLAITFLARPLAILGIGQIGDHFGLEAAFFWGAIISILAIPAIVTLPTAETSTGSAS